MVVIKNVFRKRFSDHSLKTLKTIVFQIGIIKMFFITLDLRGWTNDIVWCGYMGCNGKNCDLKAKYIGICRKTMEFAQF